MTNCVTLLRDVYGKVSLDGITIDNALTFENGSLQFRGPLVRDTQVTGNYKLDFGITSNVLREFNVVSNNKIQLFHIGANINSILTFDTNGAILEQNGNTPRGLVGGSDFSPNYNNLTYVQKIYTDANIVGKPISSTLANPTSVQNSFSITWNNTTGRFDLTPSGNITVGDNTQVIYNDGGVLVGNPLFTFNKVTNFLSTPNLDLGTDLFTGSERLIRVRSTVANAGAKLEVKGSGNITLGIKSGTIIIGDTTSVNTVQRIEANGTSTQVDLSLEPKGTEGKIYIGNVNEAGGYRYTSVRGSASNINWLLEAKGTGSIILKSSSTSPTLLGPTNEAANYRILKAGTSSNADLAIAAHGTGKVIIGDNIETTSDRYLTVGSASTDTHLHINGKGNGLVFVNGIVNYKKISIGDWNMNNTGGKTIPHGLPNHKKIVAVHAVIRNNFDGDYRPLNHVDDIQYPGMPQGGVTFWDAVVIGICRTSGGYFDDPDWNSTGYNRGWIYISYEE